LFSNKFIRSKVPLKVFSTITITVPNEPKKVQVQEINSTTIYVEWRPPRAKERNGIIRGYYVYYTVVDDNGDPAHGKEEIADTADGNKNEMVITGLRPGTRYQVAVAAYTRKGDGVRSKPKIVSTKGAGTSEAVKGDSMKSFYFVGMKFRVLMMIDMFVDT